MAGGGTLEHFLKNCSRRRKEAEPIYRPNHQSASIPGRLRLYLNRSSRCVKYTCGVGLSRQKAAVNRRTLPPWRDCRASENSHNYRGASGVRCFNTAFELTLTRKVTHFEIVSTARLSTGINSPVNLKNALNASVKAAIAAGTLMRRNLSIAKKIDSQTTHDIKLALDVRCQNLIQRTLRAAFPEIAFVGEEGSAGDSDAELRWVVDPIDGTVNFSYGIPHACVCIALQKKTKRRTLVEYLTVIGVVYDPFLNELWTASTDDVARLNGKPIRVSNRSRLGDSVCAMGYGKNEQMIGKSLRVFGSLSRKARKVRNMGSAGLALTYVACGRFDAYIEQGVSLWDIAAGGFIVERAGGEFWRERVGDKEVYRMITSNGRLRKQIEALR